MTESMGVEQRKCVVVEDVPDSLGVKDIRRHFLERKNGGNGSEFSIDVVLRFEDDNIADAVMDKSHTLSGKKVDVHAYNRPSSCVQEFTQEDFHNVLIIRGIEDIDDRDLLIHFMNVENGGDGRPFEIHRKTNDTATMKFSNPKVATSLLEGCHEVSVGNDKQLVKLGRPHDKVLLVVGGVVEPKPCLDPWIMRSLTNRFAVDVNERDDSAYIIGSLKEIAAVQEFLKSGARDSDASGLAQAGDQAAKNDEDTEKDETFKRTIVVHGIRDLSDDEVLLHFVLFENGGCGKKPQYRRIGQDMAELQFEDIKVAKNFLRRTNTIKGSGGERSVRVERPVGEILDNVRARLSPTLATDGRIGKMIEEKFQVKMTNTNDDVFITGSFTEVKRVHEFLERREFDDESRANKNERQNARVDQDVAQPTRRGAQGEGTKVKKARESDRSKQGIRVDLPGLSPELVFYILRLHNDSALIKGLVLEWGNENKTVKVNIDKARESEFMRLYSHTKSVVVRSALETTGVCKEHISKIIEGLHALVKDVSILRKGTRLAVIGSQEAINREMAKVEANLFSGECESYCPCQRSGAR